MKRCPKSNRVATEETLKFCRLDWTSLVAVAAFESPLPWIATLNMKRPLRWQSGHIIP
ncbi:MAG: hypothetical protein QOH71_2525 [Blastocatellia bacterium]|jgi:hypothetical protein|nr:hypothetical protein [Blastocatellia bacterium]